MPQYAADMPTSVEQRNWGSVGMGPVPNAPQ
eukprot:CAMPEP_0174371904 /NCGR_PEP_ID=MMETSP0811_2-20130205/101488_1 /TAXON_ID=73025 ORGANISM="Eutreptiella gymnastica-like, Strain CCMP1594" /NCGR_SAMPLE_ID=MMETSP0811_2 /ASSEMBLY_ACC=CAM_ASM_000667 /LENGTH=30 /DNA_ID= /DNA_START= /DNA_END= /DNA_ORIENTATION=